MSPPKSCVLRLPNCSSTIIENMNPSEYNKIRKMNDAIIRRIEQVTATAHRDALNAPCPSADKLRPAQKEDVTRGKILWWIYEDGAEWAIPANEPHISGSQCTEIEGCQVEWQTAFVEIE
jgi:hypothetical protein